MRASKLVKARLHFRLKKKFVDMEFTDLVQLMIGARYKTLLTDLVQLMISAMYKTLLTEKKKERNASEGTYYFDHKFVVRAQDYEFKYLMLIV